MRKAKLQWVEVKRIVKGVTIITFVAVVTLLPVSKAHAQLNATNFNTAVADADVVSTAGTSVFYKVLASGVSVGLVLWGIRTWKKPAK